MLLAEAEASGLFVQIGFVIGLVIFWAFLLWLTYGRRR